MTTDRDALLEKARDAFNAAWAAEPTVGERSRSGMRAVLDAILPEVQAQTLEDFADTLGVDVGDEDSDELRGYRNGQRQALRKAIERAAEYRKGATDV